MAELREAIDRNANESGAAFRMYKVYRMTFASHGKLLDINDIIGLIDATEDRRRADASRD